jgi:hypothetical protein
VVVRSSTVLTASSPSASPSKRLGAFAAARRSQLDFEFDSCIMNFIT